MYTALFIVAVIIFAILILGVYVKNTNRICESKKRLDGKTVLVTGGTAGMGLEISTDFAQRGARVIIACPFQEEGVNARKNIIVNTGNGNVVFKLLDLGSLKSTRNFASEILKSEERLDILINNAGVGIPGDFLTSDGMNFIMQVNYYGSFLLTLLLLPLMIKTGTPDEPCRIVNTSSFLHQIGSTEIENFNKTGYWYKIQIYGNSKLCLVLFSRELSKRLKGTNVVINNVDPGAVGTRIFESVNLLVGKIIQFLFYNLAKTPWQGAQTALHVSLDNKAGRVSGEFFKDCRLSSAIGKAYDDKRAKRLWEESVRLVQLTESELDQCFKSL